MSDEVTENVAFGSGITRCVYPHSFTAADVTASLDDFANTIKSFNRFVRGLCSVSKLARLHRNGRLLARSRRNRRGR